MKAAGSVDMNIYVLGNHASGFTLDSVDPVPIDTIRPKHAQLAKEKAAKYFLGSGGGLEPTIPEDASLPDDDAAAPAEEETAAPAAPAEEETAAPAEDDATAPPPEDAPAPATEDAPVTEDALATDNAPATEDAAPAETAPSVEDNDLTAITGAGVGEATPDVTVEEA